MNRNALFGRVFAGGLLLSALGAVPSAAQSGKWVARIPKLATRGEARLTVTPDGDTQSRAKFEIRSGGSEVQVAWEIAEGRCGTNGSPIMPSAGFPRVTTRPDGSGSVNPRINKLATGKQYYLRVYDPQKGAGTDDSIAGCANISEEP